MVDAAPLVIPAPVSIIEAGGAGFTLDSKTVIVHEKALSNEANYLNEALRPAAGIDLKLATETTGAGGSRIILKLGGKLGKEGYTLRSVAGTVTIEGADPAGVFYGIQTLRQLLPPEIYRSTKTRDVAWEVPAMEISDHPRFAWRGLLIDPARHFIPVADVKEFIDHMALHKFNRLQMHLTDDQGWRIEIKKYPRLTKIGAWREHTNNDGKRHGGFYSQEDIRDLVAYAARRHVTIVPEIEMPGHFRSAISSYPNLGVFPEKQKDLRPWTRWGISADILAPRPAGVQFCKDVLTEVMALFPGKYIHIGGDEAKKDQWQQSDEIQKMIRAKGLENEEELQAWFIRQIDAFLSANGRRLIGWDEILQGGLAPGATVMSWRGEAGGIKAANAGHDVVMAPTSHTYFDYPYTRIPTSKVYQYEPIPGAIAADKAHHVLGAQAQLWGERISTPERREYMAYPRACALAETLWSPKEARDDADFHKRLLHHLKRLKAAGISYRESK